MKKNKFGLLACGVAMAGLLYAGCGNSQESFLSGPSANAPAATTINQVANGRFFGISSVFDVSAGGTGRVSNLRGDFSLNGNGGITPGGGITLLDHAGSVFGAHLGGNYTVENTGLLNATIGSPVGNIVLSQGGLINGVNGQGAAEFANAILTMDNGDTSGTAYFVSRGTGLTPAALTGTYNVSGLNNTRVRVRGFVTGSVTFDGAGNITAAVLTSDELRAQFGGAGDFNLAAATTYTVDNDGDFSADLNFGAFVYQLRGVVGSNGNLLVTGVINDEASGTWRLTPQAAIVPRAIRAQDSAPPASGGDSSSSDRKLTKVDRTGVDSDGCTFFLNSLVDNSPTVTPGSPSMTIDFNFLDPDAPGPGEADDDDIRFTGFFIPPDGDDTDGSGQFTMTGSRDNGTATFQESTTDVTVKGDTNGTYIVTVRFSSSIPGVVASDIGRKFVFEITCPEPDPGSLDGGSDGSSDGSTDSSTDGSTDSSTDGSTDSSTDGSTDSSTDGSTDSSTDGSTDSSTDGSTDSSTDGSTDSSTDGQSIDGMSIDGMSIDGSIIDGQMEGQLNSQIDSQLDSQIDSQLDSQIDSQQ